MQYFCTQETRVCERIDEVDCSKSEQFYSLNLELYQNSAPNAEGKSLLFQTVTILTQLPETPDVPAETEAPAAKSSTTTSTTTTTKLSTQPSHYFTTSRPVVTTLSGHHFPVNSPDIRFNPEEINISLNPGGAPPDIRTNHYLQPQNVNFNSDSNKVKVGDQRTPPHLSATNTSPQTTVYRPQISSDVQFDFSEDDFRSTEHPRQQQFLIQTNSFRHSQSFPHSANQYLQPHYHSTTAKNDPSHSTTTRTLYIHSLKTPSTQHYRSEKTPERVQIPILPTIPPLTFSSPAPFSLHHHVDHKRYTKDQHPSPPRIIISASASVSDASGRRLNYSLGTIGETELVEDDYKDDVTLGDLDPFYRDVPKVKRRKRSIDEEKSPFEVIKSEKEAVEVLKFLFKWYQSHQATATMTPATSPISTDLIREINDELSPPVNVTTPKLDSEELFLSSSEEVTSTETLKKTTFLETPPSSMGSKLEFSTPELVVVTEPVRESVMEERMDTSTEKTFNPDDYIDDNYEGLSGRSSSFVDPLAALELYKHVNVNKQLSDMLQPHTPSSINVTEKERHTEINVLSEVREEVGTSTTTIATPRRRGRGRQKYPDNFQEASYTSNQINQISSSTDEGKKRRNRGRSRFISSTSTTTEPSETTKSTEATSTVSVTTALENERTETATSSPTTSQRNDPLYLVKLLKYFAETDNEMIYSSPTTDLPKTSYEPLTENQMPYFVTAIPHKDNSTKVTEKLLDKLQRLQKTLSAMDDTTATTPIVSFEALQSFGTTTALENTTSPVGLETTESSATTLTTYHSFYDDIFVVPELTDEVASTTTTQVTTEAELDTTTTVATTTESFEVEIEKSISLPVGVLSPEDAINVNSLIFSSTTEDDVQTTISPATTLIVPSIEVTSEEPTSTEFRFVTQTSAGVSTTTDPPATTTEPAPTTSDTTTSSTIETTTIMPTTVRLLEETQNPQLNSSHLEEIILETTTLSPSTTSRRRPLRRRPNHSQRIGRHRFNTELTTRAQLNSENVTEAPLLKSVLPTKTRGQITKVLLHTTPLSKQSQGRATKVGKNYVFNCFGKETNKFYADPRDCRLFHYCTHGYSKNQLLDLKYVCDHKTYFDEEKLICTKVKPPKCK